MQDNYQPPEEQPKEPEEQQSAPDDQARRDAIDRIVKSREVKPTAPIEPAQLPKGFWPSVDYLLLNPRSIMESIRQDHELVRLSRVLLLIAVVMSLIYGGVMGATNMLQGGTYTMGLKLGMIGISALKVAALFLLSTMIVLPPIYVSNTFAGAQASFRRMLALLTASMAVTCVTLASMATVAFFFALTSRSYHFIKLLHVVFFVYGGLAGLFFLSESIKGIATVSTRRTPMLLFIAWLALYLFVGTQLAWVLRPFIGNPGENFQFFRERRGSFIESVYHSGRQLMEGKDGREEEKSAE
jgi:hypothetical protein